MSISRMGHLALHFGFFWAFLGVFRAQNVSGDLITFLNKMLQQTRDLSDYVIIIPAILSRF